MAKYLDQLNRQIVLPGIPSRIVSLVPSQTELLAELGLQEEVKGITKFCVHPDSWFREKARVGGTKQVNFDKVRQLRPDLIIANKEENEKDQIELLESIAPVWISDVSSVETALHMILCIGSLTGRETRAMELIVKIKTAFAKLKPAQYIRTAYLIWKEPMMSVGSDTFIHDMMRHAGLHNVLEDQLRYPEISLETIRSRQVETLILPSEPYPFKEKDRAELQDNLPGTKVLLADGEMFSWYGSRMLQAAEYLAGFVAQIHAAKS
ncbi:MAG: ABC transporter substrate-binding protein [Chitinophagaceae bacterium]|nr:ABC transporter substrate-binding protein [Chitinophagaceae bacterium]